MNKSVSLAQLFKYFEFYYCSLGGKDNNDQYATYWHVYYL